MSRMHWATIYSRLCHVITQCHCCWSKFARISWCIFLKSVVSFNLQRKQTNKKTPNYKPDTEKRCTVSYLKETEKKYIVNQLFKSGRLIFKSQSFQMRKKKSIKSQTGPSRFWITASVYVILIGHYLNQIWNTEQKKWKKSSRRRR